MSSLKRVGISFLLVLGWMWIYRLPDGSALAEHLAQSNDQTQGYENPQGESSGLSRYKVFVFSFSPW